MPITTDTSKAPYWNVWDDGDDYLMHVFKTGVPVQSREMNGVQTQTQRQLERMGDNLFKPGTIIDGCNFTFIPNYPYVKINDNETSGIVAAIAKYGNSIVTCQASGLKAVVVDTADGFQSTDPNLKTLYLRYTNGGNDGNTAQYSPSDILTITDTTNSLYSVRIENAGSGFSNSDSLVISPALIINVASGTYANGDYITSSTGANVQIIGIDANTYATKNQLIVKVKPRTVDLANSAGSANAWLITQSTLISNPANTVQARVEGIVGSGFAGKITTDAAGHVGSIAVLLRGQGFTVPPHMSIRSANNATGIGTLVLVPQNYIGQVQVAATADAVGNGYGFSISQGVCYQKGYMLEVKPQTIVVDKYSNKPDKVSVGFETQEEIVTYLVDPNLRDPVNNQTNKGAPGADRLKMTPRLVIQGTTVADANADFFTLVSWSEGNPYHQQQVTSYSQIQETIDERSGETNGDYVVDSFLMSTRSPIDFGDEGTTYDVVVDPGIAYVGGKRIQTTTNFVIDVEKPVDTVVTNNHSVNLNYGSWLRLDEVGGVFQYNTGDLVTFYDTPKNFLSSEALIASQNVAPVGTPIGTARIRSIMNDSGIPGTKSGRHRLYVFGIKMNQGKNFKDVRSVAYQGLTANGIGDVVLDFDPSANGNVAKLQEANTSTLLFPSGTETIVTVNNVTYEYRTLDQTLAVANNGTLVKSISSSPDLFYPYTANLTTSQLQELYVVPTLIALDSNVAITGNTSVTAANTTLTGVGSSYLSDLRSGDYVYLVANTTATFRARVEQVVNGTSAILDAPPAFTNAACKVYRTFPANVPVPFGFRDGLTASVDNDQNDLTLNFGTTFQSATTMKVALGVNIRRVNAPVLAKTPHRHQFVKINTANNEGGTSGPWMIGVSDVFRLRGVYAGNSSVSNTGTNLVSSFFVDHNQNPDFLDLSWLYLAPKNNVNLAPGTTLLVEFDYFTGSGSGFYTTTSYVSGNIAQRQASDSIPLANLTTTVNSWEIPEVFDNNGNEYDLLYHYDLRPSAANTVAPGTTPATAPNDPVYALSFGNTASSASEKMFPLPGTGLVADIVSFIGRTDSVVVSGADGKVEVLKGKPDVNPAKRYAPTLPQKTMKLTDLQVPAYPQLEVVTSTDLQTMITTYVMNGRFLKKRFETRAITKPSSQAGTVIDTPKVYTMADIGQIDRRLSDVEYIVNLNMLEANVAALQIPSSIDPALNRFQYGFFADDLSTYAFSDRDNPSYAAYIEDNCAVPEKLTWDVYFNNALGGPDYIDWPIVTQQNATWPDTLGPLCVLQYVTYNIKNNNLSVPQTGASAPVQWWYGPPNGGEASSLTFLDYDPSLYAIYSPG